MTVGLSNQRFPAPNSVAFGGFDKIAHLGAGDWDDSVVGIGVDARGFEQRRCVGCVADDLEVGEGHAQPIDGRCHPQEFLGTFGAGGQDHGVEQRGRGAREKVIGGA